MDKTFLVEDTLLPKSAIYHTSKASAHDLEVRWSGEMALIKQCEDSLANLETSDFRTNSCKRSGTIGAQSNTYLNKERMLSLRKVSGSVLRA